MDFLAKFWLKIPMDDALWQHHKTTLIKIDTSGYVLHPTNSSRNLWRLNAANLCTEIFYDWVESRLIKNLVY
jgi:hypothetical protein